MPLYFAYGSNMDAAAMRERCPNARMLGRARLARHRFVLMPSGYASITRDPGSEVHGVLFDLALSDIPPLDRYEAVDEGLYVKAVQPVLREGGAPCQALIYIGTEQGEGAATPAYIDGVIAAAREVGLPPAYVAMLERLRTMPGGRVGGRAR